MCANENEVRSGSCKFFRASLTGESEVAYNGSKRWICMKKLMLFLLVLLLMTCSACTESMTVIEPLDMRVYLSQTEFTGPQEVEVSIIIYNHSDEDRPGPLALYWPNGEMIEEFGTPTLKAGERLEWTGTWFVTQEQINAGKVRFGVQYTGVNSLGLPVTREGYVEAGIVALDNGESPTRPVLVMGSNPSTGFDWNWKIDDEAVVSVSKVYVSDMYFDVPDMMPPVGGGGKARVVLSGLNPGDAVVTFTYKRPWEENALYTLVYHVRVDKNLNVTILGSSFDW